MREVCKGIPFVEIVYGKEDSIKGKWREIVAIEDDIERNNQIDKLIDTMESNSEKNSFLGASDAINVARNREYVVYLDDREIYYNFFKNFRVLSRENELSQEKISDIQLYANAINKTAEEYFGEIRYDDEKRLSLLEPKWDTNGQPIKPSIKNLKNQKCGECAECSAISHNLWLLTGFESYYVGNTKVKHAWNVWNVGKNYMIFDRALNIYEIVPNDWKEKVLNDEYLKVGTFVYSGKNKELAK